MSDAKKLKRFHVEEADDGFRLHIEDEAGSVLELDASRDQLDVIVDSLDDILSQNEEADQADD